VQVDRLAELRESRALTLRDLADRSGVDANTINQVELGHRKPRPSTLRKLAKALDIEVADFFKEPALPLGEAPREVGQSLLERAQDAARQDEKKGAQAVNRLFASEGELPSTNITEFEEDRFRAELLARGFPDEYFEDFIWPLVTMVNQQEREISRLRDENSRLREEAEQESVHR
jgi:transcriptional regulator with XRE-family HTH domain